MSGVLIIKPNVTMTAKELVSCQKSVVRMLKDGVIVLQPGYEVSYINTGDNDDESLEVGFA